ncbi:hypothetical protein FOA52_004228 [Chlamydomonas sp. UWO 241]|nr:hypothetical protein FOA52_004228 [Chlamydomonas sp. UWO 241]
MHASSSSRQRHAGPAAWSSAAAPLVAGIVSIALALAPAAPAASPADSPYNAQVEYGVTARGTIGSCPGNINPNCISTASTDGSYGPAWRATETDVQEAVRVLKNAVLGGFDEDGVALIASRSVLEGEYISFGFNTKWGPKPDVVEFLIKPEGVTGRNWEGDREGALVTYRSIGGNVRYLYPFQQVVSDFGAQKERVIRIRDAVGWSIIGCELIECYEY